MNKLLLSTILATGLAFGGATALVANEQYQDTEAQEQKLDNGTEQEFEETATEPETEAADESSVEESSVEMTEEGTGEYVVQEGDTLGSIAKEQLGSEDQWQSIAEANNIDNPDGIAVGQSLIIPAAAEGAADESEAMEETGDMEEKAMEEDSSETTPEQ